MSDQHFQRDRAQAKKAIYADLSLEPDERLVVRVVAALAAARADVWKEAIGLVATIGPKGTMNFARGYEEGVRDALRTLEAARELKP